MNIELMTLDIVKETLKKRRLGHWFPGEAEEGFVFTTRIANFGEDDLGLFWKAFKPSCMDVTNDTGNGFVHVQISWVTEYH